MSTQSRPMRLRCLAILNQKKTKINKINKINVNAKKIKPTRSQWKQQIKKSNDLKNTRNGRMRKSERSAKKNNNTLSRSQNQYLPNYSGKRPTN